MTGDKWQALAWMLVAILASFRLGWMIGAARAREQAWQAVQDVLDRRGKAADG